MHKLGHSSSVAADRAEVAHAGKVRELGGNKSASKDSGLSQIGPLRARQGLTDRTEAGDSCLDAGAIVPGMIDQDGIRERFTAVSPQLDERARRLLAATEARAAGYGGIAAASQATGITPSTIGRGLQDLAAETPPGRVRRPGGGRKPLAADDPTLRADLLKLVEPDAR